MSYIVVNIGCIECGVSSNIVGVFSDEQEANAIVARLNRTHDWREGGQNSFEVFPMPPVDVLAEEYADAQGIEAATAAETVELGSVHEHAVGGNADAPKED